MKLGGKRRGEDENDKRKWAIMRRKTRTRKERRNEEKQKINKGK